jgi:hypothetical protein
MLVALLSLAVLLAGCDGSSVTGTSPSEDAAPVSISFAAESETSSAKTMKAQRTITDSSGNTLRLDQVELLLREIEFDRADDAENCSAGGPDSDDGCAEVESGPLLVSLPLGSNSPTVVVDTTLPVGQWKEAEFEVHKLDPEVPSDSAFLQENDFPANVSIRAQGEFTPAGGSAQSFTFTSDLNAEREIEFTPPVEVTADGTTNVTFSVGLNTWFRQKDSTLVDPAKAGDRGLYEDLVEENIENSIEGFEDDDRDGEGEEENEDGDEDGDNDDNGDDDGDEDEDGDDDGDDDDGEDGDDGDEDGDEDEDGDDDGDDDDETGETEVEQSLTNTGPDPDASGEAEFEQESGETTFAVEAEELDSGTYDVVVADTTRGELDVGPGDDGTEGEVEFTEPSEPGHPLLDFDPRGKHVAVAQDSTVYLEVDFPSGGSE